MTSSTVPGTPAIELHETDPQETDLECPGTIPCSRETEQAAGAEIIDLLECEEECANESECTTEKQESQISFRDHDSESTSYHDARSSLSLVADLMSSQEEEIELEGVETEAEKEVEETVDCEVVVSQDLDSDTGA
ncbi:uncharacterized protein [Macrobrachium rosenbergii]|uniref:uncharacterized protein n=1 Tax=Macrobrachium rosenbergii TaxID=79674 RepID=UPI0034D4D85D